MTNQSKQTDIEGLLEGIADFSTVAKEIVEIAKKSTAPIAVLIVDDEPGAVEKMTESLSIMGIRSFGATSAVDALFLVDREPDINIAVVDLKMPGLDGLELVRRLRQNPARNIQCIMVSGHGIMGDVQQAVGKDVREFLLKPINSN